MGCSSFLVTILAYVVSSMALTFTVSVICRKYVPELKRLPVKYLFEPWKAPFKVQKAARCIVGDDYPEPMVDYIEQRHLCVQRLKDLCISLDILGTL